MVVSERSESAAARADRRELPRPLSDEIVRARLIDTLAGRWGRRLVTIEAPGGFGKSIAVAQAIRDNDDDPSGFDAYARCRSTHESPAAVVASLSASLGAAAPDEVDRVQAAAASVVELVAEASPADVCLWIDDVHLASEIDGFDEFVGLVLDGLPANGHLVLAGRSMPSIRRARLRAADELLEVGEDLLVFDDDEIDRLARRHGMEAAELARAGGWPAVTRLAVAAGHASSTEFVVEEVIEELRVDHRRALVVAVLAGSASGDLLRRCGVDVGLSDLLGSIPLLLDYGDAIGAHDLWHEVVDHLVDDSELRSIADEVVVHLVDVGETNAAIETALRFGMVDVALAQIMKLFEFGDDLTGTTMVETWLRLLDAQPGNGLDGRPEMLFLRACRLRFANDVRGSAGLFSRAAAGFEADDDLDGATTANTELALCSWLLSDAEIWAEVTDRSRRLCASGNERAIAKAKTGRIAVADLSGDFERVLSLYEELGDLDELGLRHAATTAVLVGDADKAVQLAEQLARKFPKPLVFGQLTATYWQVGQPRLDRSAAPTAVALDNARNQFLTLVFEAMLAPSIGQIGDADRVESMAWERNREQAFVALVRAATDLICEGEETARAGFEQRLAAIGVDDPLCQGELRRFLPYAYVLSEAARDSLDRTELGELHIRKRTLARQLLDARATPGAPIGDLPTNEAILAWLPLPWSVELAALLAQADDRRGIELARDLSDWTGAAAHRELRRLPATRPEAEAGTRAILAVVAGPPDTITSIDVAGPLAIRQGGDEVDSSRLRVRQAIELLTLRPSWTREALMSELWPDLPIEKANGNLRQTLLHVRRALEPHRQAREAPFHLRQRDATLWLHRSEWLQVDAWSIVEQLDEARRAEADGRIDDAVAARVAPLDVWTSEAYADVRSIPAAASDVGNLEHRIIADACWAGERLLSQGDHAEAQSTADRVLALDFFVERAHAVRIGALLAAGDLGGAERAIGALVEMLAEVSAPPSSGSEMLIRRFERRSGRVVERPGVVGSDPEPARKSG